MYEGRGCILGDGYHSHGDHSLHAFPRLSRCFTPGVHHCAAAQELTPTYYSGNLVGNMADLKVPIWLLLPPGRLVKTPNMILVKSEVLESLLGQHLPACREALFSNEVGTCHVGFT